jgi:antimicrobial peptide system SdpA family protein
MKAMDVQAGRGRSRAIGALMIGLTVLATTAGTYSAHLIVPHNPVKLPLEPSRAVYVFLPQGWKFFTRDPQTTDPSFYTYRNGAWHGADKLPNMRAVNLFGASREGRAQSVELGRIYSELPKSAWSDCDGEPTVCLDRLKSARTTANAAHRPSVCGTVGFILQKPVPWAWRDATIPVIMPSRVVRVEVTC